MRLKPMRLGMPAAIQITFRNMLPSPAAATRIREFVGKLELLHERIMSCRVVVRAPHRRQRKGRLYHVSIDLKVPGHEIAVNRDPPAHQAHEEINVAIRDAFDAVARRLEDVARRRRGDVKTHEDHSLGRIIRLFRDEGHGFIEAPNGDEVFFNAGCMPAELFRKLRIGRKVRYAAVTGEQGLRATLVKSMGRRHAAP